MMQESYIPEPKPVHSDLDITALYYPGTDQMAEWDMMVQTRPETKPLLGWYDEGNPENVDWQIKWAVEHGISSFCVDWYWNQGRQRLDHWLKAFGKARFKSYLKWFMMWANHNQPGAHSTEDMKAVVRFWIENYFHTPEYYTIEGKPVVTVWSLANIDRDFIAEAQASGVDLKTGEGLKRALTLCRGIAKDAGLPGIYFLGMYHSHADFRAVSALAATGGCDSLMMYNCGQNAGSYTQEEMESCENRKRIPYQMAADKARELWRKTALDKTMPVWPILPTGWDDRPRSFQGGTVLYDRTPERFRDVCADCHAFCREHHVKHVVIAPVNEWQEGSYIEPNAEYGFSMLNALRDGFCTAPAEGFPPDLQPSALGRPLLEFPPLLHPDRTSWTFDGGDTQGWYRNPFGTAQLQVIGHCLDFQRSFGGFCAIRVRPAPFAAESYSRFRVKMMCTPHPSIPAQGNERVKLLWGTEDSPVFTTELVVREEASCTAPLFADGQWHDYTLELSGNPRWHGKVNELWFDSGALVMSHVKIQLMAFE